MITHVAIKQSDGKIFFLPKPYRHADVIKIIQNPKDIIFGFLNHNNIFLNRKDAWHEAYNCKQILPPYNPIDTSQRAWNLEINNKPCDLFSEDIW